MISAPDREKLYKAQKTCVRLLGGQKKKRDINSIFKESNIISFPDMIQMELCKYGFKITKKLLPEPLIIRLAHDREGKKVHRYDTRNKYVPNVQLHKSPQFNNSFMCQGMKELGKLPQSMHH